MPFEFVDDNEYSLIMKFTYFLCLLPTVKDLTKLFKVHLLYTLERTHRIGKRLMRRTRNTRKLMLFIYVASIYTYLSNTYLATGQRPAAYLIKKYKWNAAFLHWNLLYGLYFVCSNRQYLL